jgi:hypothetical protein
MSKLTPAQEDALRQISQAGGHGVGADSYLPSRTAEVLARLGLVVLGWKSLSGRPRRRRWAIGAGQPEPYGFTSDAEDDARNKAFMAGIPARLEARIQAVLAHVRAHPKPGEAPEVHAARLAEIERVIRSDSRYLAQAEDMVSGRAVPPPPAQPNPRRRVLTVSQAYDEIALTPGEHDLVADRGGGWDLYRARLSDGTAWFYVFNRETGEIVTGSAPGDRDGL